MNRTSQHSADGDSGRDDVARHIPLTPKVLHILMALAEGPANGYRLGLDVEEASGGAVRISAGTLYENIDRLHQRGLIEEAKQPSQADGRKQRFWTLTPLGLRVLQAELARLRTTLRMADGIPGLAEGAS